MSKDNILIIADQAESRERIVAEILAWGGYTVAAANTIEQAQQHLADPQPDLLLLHDIPHGPDLLDVLSRIRRKGLSCPAVLLVGADVTQMSLRAYQLAVIDVVPAPHTGERLRKAIETALRVPHLQRECRHHQERLINQLEEYKRLYAIGRVLCEQDDADQIARRFVEAAVYVTAGDEGRFFVQQDESDALRIQGEMVQGQQTARVVDMDVQDPLVQRVFRSGGPNLIAPPDVPPEAPAPVVIDVPLIVHGRTTGVLRVLRVDADRPFQSMAYHKLSVLAHFAAIAFERIELMSGIHSAIERAALSQISAFFGRTLHMQEVLQMVMDVAVRVVNADCGYVVVYDEQSGRYIPRVAHGVELKDISSDAFIIARQIVSHVIQEREAVVTATNANGAEGETDQEARSAICVPMEGGKRVIGAIYVEHPHRRSQFLEHHRSMLNTLSVNAAAAIDNARLFNQIEAERSKLDAVLRGTEQPIIVTDFEGTVLLMNQAARRAFDTQAFRGTGMLLPQVIEHPDLANLFEQARISAQIQHDEIEIETGQSFSATVTPISDVGLVTVMQDITEIKKLSEIKSEFVATVSHDIRSPLSTVQGFLSVLGQAGPLNEQQIDFIESAQQEVTRLFDLTHDLLDLGRLESGIDLDMERCDLVEIVGNAIAHWTPRAAEQGHILVPDLPAEPMLIAGNPILLRRMLDNLLSNAIKYTLAAGQIEIQLARVGREAALQITDTGVGIAIEDQPYIFDRFFRVRSQETRDIEGTGLGLAIVRGVAERHGGRTWVESERGEGTTIGIVLPLVQ